MSISKKFKIDTINVVRYLGVRITDEAATVVDPPLPHSKKVLLFVPSLQENVLVPRADVSPSI